FEACEEMWKGFKHNNNRRLNMNDCVIRDAETGIEMSDNAKIWSRKDVFEDCYAGIRIPEAGQPQNIINSFIQSVFAARNTLKPAYSGQVFHNTRMFTGIWASHATQINVQTCRFENVMFAGIHAEYSSVSCSGSTFSDSLSVMRGIHINNNGPASNITGNTFKNVYLGVFNQGSGIASRMNIVNQNHFIRNSGINSMDG